MGEFVVTWSFYFIDFNFGCIGDIVISFSVDVLFVISLMLLLLLLLLLLLSLSPTWLLQLFFFRQLLQLMGIFSVIYAVVVIVVVAAALVDAVVGVVVTVVYVFVAP